MDRSAAQEVLLRYRPGTSDALEPDVKEALALAATDAELGLWLEQTLAMGEAVRAAVRGIPVPAGLGQAILDAENRRRREMFRRQVIVRYAIAASVALLASLLMLQFLRPSHDNFTAYRDRMVRTALRSYRMDMLSANLGEIRSFLAKNHAHGDFVLPAGLRQLPGVGCAVLRWHDHPVSLVCLESPEHQILYLFVTARSQLNGEPAEPVPSHQTISTLATASWSQGDNTYILASADGEAVRRLKF